MSRCFGLDVELARRSARFKERGGIAMNSESHVVIPFRVRYLHTGNVPLLTQYKRHKWNENNEFCIRCEHRREK